MERIVIATFLLVLLCQSGYSQNQIDNLSISMGYSSSFPKARNLADSHSTRTEHNLIMNVSYTSKLYKNFHYTLGKGLVKLNSNSSFPINEMQEMNKQKIGSMPAVNFNYNLQGLAGLRYHIVSGSKHNKWNLGLLGVYDISLRKETDEESVDFRMKEHFLEFSNAEIFSTIEYRRDQISLDVGFRVCRLRLSPKSLDSNSNGLHFRNTPKFRLAITYHFKSENLMRGALNFPEVAPDVF